MLCEIALNTRVLTDTSEAGLPTVEKLHSTFLLVHPPHDGFPSSHCLHVSYTTRRDSSRRLDLIMSLLALIATTATLLMRSSLPFSNRTASHDACPNLVERVQRVKVFGRGNVQAKIKRQWQQPVSDAHGFSGPPKYRDSFHHILQARFI